MSTKRKTLKQKKMSELRKTNSASDMSVSTPLPLYSFNGPTLSPASTPTTTKNITFSYDLSEIRTSLIISTLLVIANSIVFILVRNNSIPLRIFGL